MAKIRKSFPVDNASKFFDIDSESGEGGLFRPGRQPRGTDNGVDRLGRDFQSNDPIPEAGGPTGGLRDAWLGESGDISTGFKPMGAGEQPMIGGATRSNTSGNPTQEYIFNQPGSVATRVGPNFVLSPIDPGISPAAPQENFAKTLKSRVAKGLGRGMFSDVILGGETSGFMDPEVNALIQKSLDNRAEARRVALAKAQASLGKAAYDEQEQEQEQADDEEKTADRWNQDGSARKDESEETSKSSGIWAIHQQRKAMRTEALTSKRQNGGRLNGGRI